MSQHRNMSLQEPLLTFSCSAVADQLCFSAQQDPGSGDGICQDTFGAARDFVDAKTPLSQSQQFGCLLDLLCVAHAGPQDEGTCNQLLAASGMSAPKRKNNEKCADQSSFARLYRQQNYWSAEPGVLLTGRKSNQGSCWPACVFFIRYRAI